MTVESPFAAPPRTPRRRRSTPPLYAQVKDELGRRIRRGEIAPGAAFFSERELTAHFGVSSITTRRVMAELVREGWIVRRNDVGTFVRAEAPSKRLALLVLEFKESPQLGHRMIASAFGELVGGVAQAAWEVGARLELAYIGSPEELIAWLDRSVADRTVDGVLVRAAGDITAEEKDQLDAAGLPYVLVKRRVPGREAACVITDEREAVRLGVNHLIRLGHRRIGFVASRQSSVLYDDAYEGYRGALAAAGLEFDARLVSPGGDFSNQGGERAAGVLLDRPSSIRPTALLVASDSMSIGAYQAAAHRRLVVPTDLSIASVNDIPEARALHPALTTVRTSHQEFGVRATRLLLDAIDAAWKGQPLRSTIDVIQPVLIIRESTAPPASTDGVSDLQCP